MFTSITKIARSRHTRGDITWQKISAELDGTRDTIAMFETVEAADAFQAKLNAYIIKAEYDEEVFDKLNSIKQARSEN